MGENLGFSGTAQRGEPYFLGGRQCLNVGSVSMSMSIELPVQGSGEKEVNGKTNLADKSERGF